MSAHQMLCHLNDAFGLYMGAIRTAPLGFPYPSKLLKWGCLWVPVRWPKGFRTVPEVDQERTGTRPVEFQKDAAEFKILLNRFAGLADDFVWPIHPLLGQMSRTEWMRLAYLHTDHHLPPVWSVSFRCMTSPQSLTELLRGKGAHADPLACIEDLPTQLAEYHIDGFPHSIVDIVFHMNYWMNYELKRIRGQKPKYPEHNAESFPSTPQNWDQLKRDFSWFLSEFAKLAKSTAEEFNREIESSSAALEQQSSKLSSVEAILWQMVAHNSYHTGQIVMVRQALKAWPPKSGGDTW